MIEPMVHFGEGSMHKALNKKVQGRRDMSPISFRCLRCFEKEGGDDPAHGQRGVDHENLNGSQMPLKEARDIPVPENGPIIKLGLTNHTTATTSQNNCDSPLVHKADNGSAGKAYSWNSGCSKQEPQQNGNQHLMGAVKTFNQQQPLVDSASAFTGSKGQKSPMDRGALQHGIQNKLVVTSTNTDGISTD